MEFGLANVPQNRTDLTYQQLKQPRYFIYKRLVMKNDRRLKQTLWNRNFFLLWQGHFVSAVGSVIYGIAISFAVLDSTGSTTAMGAVAAVSQLPRIVLAPFAGVVIDRTSKKSILIGGDIIAGLSVLAVALLAFIGYVKIWVLVAAALLLGSIQTFLDPAIHAGLPSLVPTDKLTQANSAYSLIGSGSQIIGRFAGGYLYGLLGAPISFLLNGISFLLSALSETFIKSEKLSSPAMSENGRTRTISQDISDSFRLLGSVPGLLQVFIVVAFLNFCGFFIITLYVPLFQLSINLGAKAYGLVMAFSTMGMFAGGAIFSKITIPKPLRVYYFAGAGFLSNALMIAFPYHKSTAVLGAVIFASGLISAPINVVLNSALQTSISSDYRGRVFALVDMIGGILVPVAMVAAGALAEILDVRLLIAINAAILAIVFLVVIASGKTRAFLN